jgi:hypothetical protein
MRIWDSIQPGLYKFHRMIAPGSWFLQIQAKIIGMGMAEEVQLMQMVTSRETSRTYLGDKAWKWNQQ